MTAAGTELRPRTETLELPSAVPVDEQEYRRLLGYPPGHVPGERAQELAAWARETYARCSRPWIYLRPATLEWSDGVLRLDGTPFVSPRLLTHFQQLAASSAMLMAVSAGAGCEEEARRLWEAGHPDEYFFLEIMGSAVVEQLVAQANARVCAAAERDGLVALPHYSPGYTGWDVAEQNRLHAVIVQGAGQAFPEALDVLPSGMLRPKKALLAVIGLAPAGRGGEERRPGTPCTHCAYSPCGYRREPYRHARWRRPAAAVQAAADPVAPLTLNARYTVNSRALRRWSQERVQLSRRDDGGWEARFRFDGTTCSNMGVPLAFDYVVELAPAEQRYAIRSALCAPAEGDDGYTSMCAYLRDPGGLMQAIADEKPLLGRPLDDVLAWTRTPASSGCYCDPDSRAHKWGLAFEAIHFALAQTARAPSSPGSSAS